MKTLFTTIILSLAVFSCFAQKIKNDLETNNLKGNVDYVIEKRFNYFKNGKTFESDLANEIISKYNSYGNLVTQTSYYHMPVLGDNIDTLKSIFKYDNKQRLIERDVYRKRQKTPYQKTVYVYNELKRERKSKDFFSGDNSINTDYISYKYDDEGRLIEMAIIVQRNKPLSIFRYHYDSDGNQVEEDEFHEDEDGGKMIQITTTKSLYDKFGNKLTSKIVHDIGETETHVYNYKKYDDAGNWTIMGDSKDNGNIGEKTLRRIVYRTK
ncbi:hypothetical protein [Mucilaginibacter jinjuensis]|uniref:YD repeat-containing protein n=1 Tax=Mucilaginibacter jinjuensis TaxID=1176721 RepID=A0ABY7T9U5_9SPHI|nr:hypothetical protein [Mucilaginibacter jinjuensis]WCT12880.1 hypothetical protein PQO05_02895 [Mucilaginibacter jinjuensis]